MSTFSCKTAAELLAKTRDRMDRLRLERTEALALAAQKAAAIDAIESVLWRIEELAKHEAEQVAMTVANNGAGGQQS